MTKPAPKLIQPEDVAKLAREVIQNDKFPMLASVDGEHPRVRPVSPVRTDGFVIYVANLRQYHKTVELAANPRVELCYLDKQHNQVRLSGTAEVLTDGEELKKIWEGNTLLRQFLGDMGNPDLIVYRIIPQRVRYMQEWALEYHEVPL